MALVPNDSSRSSAAPDPRIGQTLGGRYVVERKLGDGGLGSVYAGRQLAVGRAVAIKLLHADVAARGEHRQRFEREAQTLAALRHPNIVGIVDFGVDGDASYLVMELAEGRTLAERIAEGPLPLPVAIDLVRQLLRALACAHALQIVHRDLKPANIIVRDLPDGSQHLVVLDFGIAKFLDEPDQPALTKQGAILGTPAYMAPEQATGGTARPTVDVYAAGLVVFEILTGRRPFLDTDRGALLRAHLMAPAPLPTSIRPELASIAGIDGFVLKALEKKPANRFEDAARMLEAFESSVRGAAARESSVPTPAPASTPASTPVSPAPSAHPQTPAARRWPLPVAASAVLALGGVAWFVARSMSAPAALPPPPVVPLPPVIPAIASPTAPTPLDRGIPPELESLHRAIDAGQNPSRERLQTLYRYNAAHPDDARGELLLGFTCASRRWYSDATEAYDAACRREPSSSNHPRLRADLIRIAGTNRFGEPAGRVVASCLGSGARREVEAAARSATDSDTRERLQALAARLVE